MSKSIRMRTPARVPQTPATLKTPRSRPHSGQSSSGSAAAKDAVQVFCRIRPLQSDADLTCFRVISPTTVVMTPPEMAINYKVAKETQYVFKHVFDANSKQRDMYNVVAQPLVENLIKGKNGLLFTYGVTGSGKTYTMTGNANDQGIMPRCLDALFSTISDYQTKKFVFKPDRLNGFEILSEADAMLERQADMNARFAKTRRRDMSDPEIASRASTEPAPIDCVDEDNMYAVFITYVEVYNNSVYDLLEENAAGTNATKTLQSKIIREDCNHTMFVHGVHELEVKTVHDAIEAFQTGQKRKRMGHTILNAESSRSHSVFTIRLVQAPTDQQGEQIMQDRRTITVSQLSLVDLAGSERTNRTKNTGQRLREAGNINNSLMTLRSCLEVLRENQVSNVQKKVPYRDAKVTHMFKSYFDGEGVVRMVVCVNPRAEDYDESVQVMKFAEMTQEVQIARPTPMKPQPMDAGLTPGRRKANQLFRIAVNNLVDVGNSDARKLNVDLGLVYSLSANFPDYRLDSPEADQIIVQLVQHLEQRIQKRKILLDDFDARQSNFRMSLVAMERENISLRSENAAMKAVLQQERQRITIHEKKLIIYEHSIDELNKKMRNRENEIRDLRTQVEQKQQMLTQKDIEKDKQKRRYNSKFAVEQDKLTREMEAKMEQHKLAMRDELRDKENKLKQVGEILKSNYHNGSHFDGGNSTSQVVDVERTPRTLATDSQSIFATPSRVHRGVAVANARHRRSRSTDERWLEHRAPNPVPLGTILQPYYRNRKSITKLTDARDITNPKTSKYCLVSQAADTDGEVETRLYKGNVIPTTGGGAQVIFNDVECLKQLSPVTSPQRKRPSNGTTTTGLLSPGRELESKCSVGIEGHSHKKPKH